DYASDGDILCRLGGDEFIMFIEGDKTKEELGKLAGNLIKDITARILNAGYSTGTTVSVGISRYPADGDSFLSLSSAADKALYFVKQKGKGAYHFYREEKADEKKREESLVDIRYLKDYLARSDANNGSYILNLESFNHVYNFIRRVVERTDSEVHTILFTFSYVVTEAYDSENVLEVFEKAIFTSLRRVDVSTRYSGRQILVVLMNASEKNSVSIAERIMGSFHDIYTGPEVDIRYEIERLERK
ncbi:MAG: GGDEF domain-containing protein, partial [Oscillospiraceae bacterium]|nr:GGDEF domain-containing protein [Oscillospiraceae bacterium]